MRTKIPFLAFSAAPMGEAGREKVRYAARELGFIPSAPGSHWKVWPFKDSVCWGS